MAKAVHRALQLEQLVFGDAEEAGEVSRRLGVDIAGAVLLHALQECGGDVAAPHGPAIAGCTL
eukprot:1339313-Alexandrium_andersonii.AAC.1